MRRASKYLAVARGFLMLAVILVFVLGWSRKHTAGFGVQAARDTCGCYPDYSRIVVLRLSNEGEITINSEPVKVSQLASRLREIYGTHAERVLYLFPEEDAPFERVANVIDVVQHLQSEKSDASAIPKGLQAQPENMNIQIRLVTPLAINTPCPQNCFNWAVKGIPRSSLVLHTLTKS